MSSPNLSATASAHERTRRPAGRPAGRGAERWPAQAVALLTGSTSGLGKELFIQLCRAGAAVHVLVHPRHDRTTSWTAEADGHAASVTVCDLADPQQTEAAAAHIARSVPELNTLILCAGISAYGPVDQLSWRVVQEVIVVNYLANAIVVHALLPRLRAQPQARIIGIGSGAALLGLRGTSAYAASKAAFQSLC